MPSGTCHPRQSFKPATTAHDHRIREEGHREPAMLACRAALVVAMFALAPWTARAQADAPPHGLIDQLHREHAHDVLRVTGPFGQFIGHAVTIDASGFSGLQPAAGELQPPLAHDAIAWNQVSRVDRRGHSTKYGALLGALCGGAAGGAFGVEVANSVGDGGNTAAGFGVGLVVGALPGAAIGALAGRFIPRWVTVFDRQSAAIAERGGN